MMIKSPRTTIGPANSNLCAQCIANLLTFAPDISSQCSSARKRGDRSSPLLSVVAASIGVTGCRRCGIIRTRAQGTQASFVRNTDHGKRSGLMLSVERRGLGRVEVTAGQGRGIFGIIEPETKIERVGRNQADVGVKAADVVQKNRLSLDISVIRLLPTLDIALIPVTTEA